MREPRFYVPLRSALFSYLLGLHAILGGVAWYLLREHPAIRLPVEAVFLLSLILGYRLLRSFFVPLELLGIGTKMLEEGEFTTRFRSVGQREFDELLAVYNRMADRLRDERLRVREQNEFLDHLVSASPAGVLVCDFDGKIETTNPAAVSILGIDEEDLLGQSPETLPVLSEIDPASSAPRPKILSLPSGRRIRATAGAFRDRGFLRQFFLLEELTEELRRTEKEAYGKLIRLISHEVNNSVGPVTSLLDSVALYGQQLTDLDRQRFDNGLAVASQRLDNLRHFVEGFAAVVKLPPPEPRPVDLLRLLDEVLILHGPTFESRNIRLEWRQCDDLGLVRLDKNQMEQVLINLIKNSVEAIEEGHGPVLERPATAESAEKVPGTLTLEATASDTGLRLVLEDNGTGIPPEVEDQLFRPFFSSKENGRGLGLTLVSEILGAHGIAYSLANSEHGGARFVMEIPRELRVR